MGPWSVLGIESSDLCADTGQLLQVDRKFHRRWDRMCFKLSKKAPGKRHNFIPMETEQRIKIGHAEVFFIRVLLFLGSISGFKKWDNIVP